MKAIWEIILQSPYSGAFKIALILVASVVLYLVLKLFLQKVGKRVVSITRSEIDDKILEFLDKFLARMIIIIAIYFIAEALAMYLGEKALRIVNGLLFTIVVIIATSLTIRFTVLITDYYLKRTAKKTGTEIDREFGPLVNRIIQIVFFLTGLLIILDHFNIDAKGLVATLGIGSLAVALAAQDTLSNMIAGFVIMFDRPFRPGDRIRTPDGTVGEITEIGLRSVKLLDFEKNLHIIPNSEIVKSTIINYSYPNPLIRVRVDVGVAYGSDLNRVKEIILQVFKEHPTITDDPEPAVYFINFGDSSLDLMCVGYVPHYTEAWKTAEEIRLKIYEAFEKEGIEIPFPQRVVHLPDFPRNPSGETNS